MRVLSQLPSHAHWPSCALGTALCSPSARCTGHPAARRRISSAVCLQGTSSDGRQFGPLHHWSRMRPARPGRRSAHVFAPTSISSSALPASRPLRDVGVYVHYPYCRKRCAYCAFNVYRLPHALGGGNGDFRDHRHSHGDDAVAADGGGAYREAGSADKPKVKERHHFRERDGIAAYLREIEHAFTAIEGDPLAYHVKSIYFGGGTPSLASIEWFKRTIEAIQGHAFSTSGKLEVTAEVNPSDVTPLLLARMREAGINRLSLGVQSLDDNVLKLFDRDHSGRQAYHAIQLAKDIFPGRVSLDFIWGYPGQSLGDWKRELDVRFCHFGGREAVTDCQIRRKSSRLAHADGLLQPRMFKDFADSPQMPSDEVMADLYALTVEAAQARGFEQYEVSSFARRGAYGAHNLGYWQGRDYMGIGPGAHGRVTESRGGKLSRMQTYRILSPGEWEAACLSERGHGMHRSHRMSDKEVAEDALVFGLRMPGRGVEFDAIVAITSVDVQNFIDHSQISALVDGGFLARDRTPDRLRCTPKGLAVLDSLLPRIVSA